MDNEVYKQLMEFLEKVQDKKRAIVILETEDGGTDYLRYNLDYAESQELIKKAYMQSN